MRAASGKTSAIPVVPADVLALEKRLAAYLPQEQILRVRRAYEIGAQAHSGQTRKSGEPYITHPVAVAGILVDLGVDAETIIAAILHDTLEDTLLSREELEHEFGAAVAEMVDGVTKLDKVQFKSRQEAAAESFRKMLLAMARDLRVILIKLADRLHNMRTIGSMAIDSRRRIARETLDIYAPIAQRLGMNQFKAELQDLGFRALYPDRHRIIEARIKNVLGNRREAMGKIEMACSARLDHEKLAHRIVSRIKSPYSIYTKMREDRKTFAQVMDVYGFRVVVPQVMNCYHALGAVHGLYKPLDTRFRDFIAIPKANGYQSLHTVLFGPFGAPIEIQIRTEDMDTVAERGVAAHWVYKNDGSAVNSAQNRAREWVAGLVDAQTRESSSIDFLENVKVDLFPDEVYLFTPKGRILALPRNASALDFAYAVHTDVGDHAVAARIDTKLAPLRTRLSSGQTVEIITAPSAVPSPQWLEYVVSSKARTAIRHFLKHLQHEDAVELGHRMLDRALDARNISFDSIPTDVLDRFVLDNKFKRLEELLADIALGNRMPDQVARQLLEMQGDLAHTHQPRAHEKILISGAERGVLSFARCCYPIPGDAIVGYLSAGKGVVVHRAECPNVADYRKTPERLVAMDWDANVQGDYRAQLRVESDNKPGVLATVAAAIAEADSNIENVEYKELDNQYATLLFTIEVRNTQHFDAVVRRVQRAIVVHGAYRHP
ncbi:bifunctional (p)ppGpp synthetase/guanosine-3',5'-bis(diphosphate) 3'-pyrophosphohydrolase [Pseudolysobacter antarcticus]|uniref:guanosine-3',5'-bis(diphosphate) 3'-diphosphatase n=1 Tax=Pseudolysobacter antarcticus TaxID=2511995 RepID=A0A411HFX7_9GAMM|nr:bifunctional (p)ppGpp synthetase/guanosine-3',5'-bis(diphosphate) 3'-pyrophosphohydrolase [Pseudolysobacter antarcticus]QBB69403.1 bifunctional (p)ppGpp synthetase/guanosine-3',5'-bis(diphosphate) 3'-pyrophosphohydrolase [Pseudolysobacter antarcticus]